MILPTKNKVNVYLLNNETFLGTVKSQDDTHIVLHCEQIDHFHGEHDVFIPLQMIVRIIT